MGQNVIHRKRDRFTDFHDLLKLRGFDSYDAYLASPQWADFKRWYASSSLPQSCLVCGSSHYILHHWNYDNVAQEDIADVIPLCDEDHLKLHRWLAANESKIYEVERHLIRCFGMNNGQAKRAFKPFKRRRSENKQRIIEAQIVLRYCQQCKRCIPLDHPKDFCWKCHNKIRKTLPRAPSFRSLLPVCKGCGKHRKPNRFVDGICMLCLKARGDHKKTSSEYWTPDKITEVNSYSGVAIRKPR